jgi:hypothetical protein
VNDEEVAQSLRASCIVTSKITSAIEYDDSMLIRWLDENGRGWGMVIEFDAPQVRATANYLRAQGVVVKESNAACV